MEAGYIFRFSSRKKKVNKAEINVQICMTKKLEVY